MKMINFHKSEVVEVDKIKAGELAACMNNLKNGDVLFVTGMEDAKEINLLLLEEYFKFNYVTALIGKQKIDKIIKINMPEIKVVFINKWELYKNFEIEQVKKVEMFYPERNAEEIKRRYIELKEMNLYF